MNEKLKKLARAYMIVHDGSYIHEVCETEADFAWFVANYDSQPTTIVRASEDSDEAGLAAIKFTNTFGKSHTGLYEYDADKTDDEIIVEWYRNLKDISSIVGDNTRYEDYSSLAEVYIVESDLVTLTYAPFAFVVSGDEIVEACDVESEFAVFFWKRIHGKNRFKVERDGNECVLLSVSDNDETEEVLRSDFEWLYDDEADMRRSPDKALVEWCEQITGYMKTMRMGENKVVFRMHRDHENSPYRDFLAKWHKRQEDIQAELRG